jgi:hypothetical protein
MQPGRVDSRRPVPGCVGPRRAFGSWALLLSACAMALVACARSSSPPPPPHRELAPIWREYRELKAERALAIAGELRHDHWVAGASGGHATRGEAEARALVECRRRRAQRRMQAPCLLYAVGDEVTWPGR